jgi:hypothetical protein
MESLFVAGATMNGDRWRKMPLSEWRMASDEFLENPGSDALLRVWNSR